VERMLTELLGMEWYKVHDEAERLEHAVSDDLEEKLILKLGEAGPCPHGYEADMGAAQRRKSGLRPLAEVPAGVRVQVAALYERDRSLLEYLDGLGIHPGSQAEVLTRNYDETMVLGLDGEQVHLGEAGAKRVWVKILTSAAGN